MQDEANPGQDREARILARRKRIEEQLGAKAGDGGEQGRRKKEEAAAEEARSKVQISETRGKIDKIKTAGHAEVTTIRIVGDSRENERRINEEVNRQGRRQKLLHEAESSARQNAAVAMKWSALFEREIPQDLLENYAPSWRRYDVDDEGSHSTGWSVTPDPEALAGLQRGVRVRHDLYGSGVVRRIAGRGMNARAIVRFDDGVEREFVLEYAGLQLLVYMEF